MYRGRPQLRGYRPPFEGRGLPLPRPYPAPSYRDDRSRPRPFNPGYHDHGPADPYRRSPPRRRYPSPGSGGPRGPEYWAGGPPRERSPSPRGPGPIDRNLVITVGNELIGSSGSAPSRHADRDYPPRTDYERSRSPARSRAKSRGRSKSRARSQSCSPDRSRAKSRARSRGRSRSPDRSRGKSRGRSRSRSRSPDRRAKSRGRSRGRGRSKSHSPDRSRGKSRGRSKSRPRSRSRSRSGSRGRDHGRSKSRRRSRSSSSSSSSGEDSDEKSRKEFRELETARRRKELEEMLSQPTKSILKKRTESEDSPSLRATDSPRRLEGPSMSRVADQLLQAVKGMEPQMVASVLSELRSDPHLAQRSGMDAEMKEILHLLAPPPARSQEKADEIDDEEKFLYGDSEDPKPPTPSQFIRHQELDLYGDVTDEVLYGDYAPQTHVLAQTYGLQGVPPHLQNLPPPHPDTDERRITIPPGTEPLEEGERQAVEEYEKIQDLLKTIGLDLGVTEISKMAARTKERLHGNKPPPKTPTRSRKYSSGSSDGSRDRGRRSRSSSSSSSRGRGGSWSSDDGGRKCPSPPKPHKDREPNKEPLPPAADIVHAHPAMPPYPPPQVHGMMLPNFPPPGYSQYGNYLPYMHQQWPPMYPPPNMALPPPAGPEEFTPPLPYNPPYSQPEPEVKGRTSVHDPDKGRETKVSEQQNNESQKQKVLEERENLKQAREMRMKKKEYLMKELERLRKQQGELLRKKRREKGGHKDPLLQEISHLQEEVMAQISSLRKEHEAAEKKRNEIEKIALILGLTPSDRPRCAVRPAEDMEDDSEKKKPERRTEKRQEAVAATIKQTAAVASSSRAPQVEPPPAVAPPPAVDPAPAAPQAPPPEPFEYYDAGNHWCRNCNVTSGSMFDFFTHLHSKTHRKTLDPYDRPWASSPSKITKNPQSEEKLTKPAKGSEFLLPVRGFFCLLCQQFYGDAICAEEHATTHSHNEKYKKQMYENPLYEQRRNLDRQAGLASDTTGKKRKHEEEEKKEEKTKHKKEKKDKEEKEEESGTVQKEEKSRKEEEEVKKEEGMKNTRSLEEKLHYKEEEEKYRCSKKEDKYRHREEEERAKYRKEEEHRFRYRRDEGDHYDSRPKYGLKNEGGKYGKFSDSRSKPDRGEAEKDLLKKTEVGKLTERPETRPEPPPKPYEPPRIFCGPSPAMRAKLRKQSLETGKLASAAAGPSFGKFTWKKRENILAKEAEKVAAEFLKDDEEAMKQNPVSVEDSFAKSMAVAKEIANKLGDNTTPPWVPRHANRGRIRPNLPAPAAVLRKTAMMGKPAPLNTFLSIRPQNSLGLIPNRTIPQAAFSDGLNKVLDIQKSLLDIKAQVVGAFGTASKESRPAPFGPKPAPSSGGSGTAPKESRPAPFGPKPAPSSGAPGSAPTESRPVPFGPQPAPSSGAPGTAPTESRPVPFGPQPAPSSGAPGTAPKESRPAPFGPKPAPSSGAPGTAPKESRPAPFGPKPAPSSGAPGTAPTESRPAPFGPKPAPSSGAPGTAPTESRPAPFGPKPAPSSGAPGSAPTESRPAPFGPKPAPSSGAPGSAPTESRPAPFGPKPRPTSFEVKPAQPSLVEVVSDVAAPGVPEAEQTRMVFVKPPPFINKGEGGLKSEKLKSNLAAAKAQDLFDIFYSQSGTSSITKPSVDGNGTSKNKLPATQAPKSQPLLSSQCQTPSEVCKALQPDPSPQTQPEADIQIASVWSLQSLPAPTPEVVQTEAQTVSKKQNSTQKSQIVSQTNPVELEVTSETESLPRPATQIRTELEPEKESHPENRPDTAPVPAPKPGPRTRGKRTPPAPCPVRQTRSQTRYQTRQQQQSHSEADPEPTSGDSDSAASGLDTSDPGSGLLLGEENPNKMEITPETLGLPSDMTSLDFDYDFNFE